MWRECVEGVCTSASRLRQLSLQLLPKSLACTVQMLRPPPWKPGVAGLEKTAASLPRLPAEFEVCC